MSPEHVLERVKALVISIAGARRTPPDAGPDTCLGENGLWLTSVDLLEVIVACEQDFEIVFEAPTDLTAETLRTIGSLAAVVRAKIAE